MLVGGLLLTMTAASLGEFSGFQVNRDFGCRPGGIGLPHLAGSIAAFTAYLWLIHHESPTKVSTYAYVNPRVAVFLGYFLRAEETGPRTVIATLFTGSSEHLGSFPAQRPFCSAITIISRSLPYPRILARGCFLDELTCVERFIICSKTKACSTNQPSAR